MLAAWASAFPALFRDNGRVPAAAIPVLAVLVAPLVIRRVFPALVLAWLIGATALAWLWDDRVLPGFALLIALYTVASMQSRRDAIVAATCLELAVIGTT
jgi:hypothetical protein